MSGANKDSRARLVLVDDHAIVRSGVKMLIEAEPDFRVVGEAKDGASARMVVAKEKPDVVVLDIDLGAENGLDLLADLAAAAPAAKILVLTGVRDPEARRQAFHCGALGLVDKEAAADVLPKAIRTILGGEVWYDRTTMAKLLADVQRGKRETTRGSEAEKTDRLTPREREVIALIGEGLSNKRIAERLGISETTIRHHLTSIFDKLEVHDRLELLLYAHKRGLARPPATEG